VARTNMVASPSLFGLGFFCVAALSASTDVDATTKKIALFALA
jgi:hypothetical protein